MRALVTGAAGFIGSRLCNHLISQGYHVVGVDNLERGLASRVAHSDRMKFVRCDVTRTRELSKLAKGCDVLFHLAAINGTDNFYKIPLRVLEVGVLGAFSAVEACKLAGVGSIVLASSAEVYQDAPVVPTPESVPLIVPDPANPRFSYGASKLITEVLAMNLVSTNYFSLVQVFRPHNIYGSDMGWQHVIPQLTRKMKAAKDANLNSIELNSSGKETRAFCYVDDAAQGIELMFNKGESGIYHIGNAEEISIEALASKIATEIGFQGEIKPSPAPVVSSVRRCPNIAKMAELGFRPAISLDDGLKTTVEWYLDNMQVVGSNGLL